MRSDPLHGRSVANLPNLLTFFRILVIPLFVVLLHDPGRTESIVTAALFFLACWSDFLDGYLARRRGIITPLGKLLDPLADKLIVMAALVMLAATMREPRVPAWMVVLIVGRELAVTGLRAIAVSEGIVLAADELGKYKMIFQMFALHGLLLHYSFFGIDFHAAGMYFLWIALVVGLWSAVGYHVHVIRLAVRDRPART
jgi:CDP-diacylglycerol--glycerol-3-phosphate 3-phosphatidyltransferase